jgi:hypothetical protein
MALGFFFLYLVPSLNIALNADATQIGIMFTIVGFVEGISGLAFAIYDLRLKRITAKEALKKASLGVVVMGQRLIPNSEIDEIDFGCSAGKDDEVICIVPVSIVNTGDLSAKNLHVRLSLPLNLFGTRLGNNLIGWKISGAYDISDVKKKVWIKKSFKNVHFLFPELGVHEDYLLEIPISVTSSSARLLESNEASDDELPFDANLLPSLAPQVYVKVSATDIEPAQGHFSIRYFKARDIEELMNEIKKDIDNALEKMLDNPQAPRDIVKNVMVIMPELKLLPKSMYGQPVKGTTYKGKYVEAGFVSLEVNMSKRTKIVRKSKLKTDPLLRGVVHIRKGNMTISKRRKLREENQS